MTDIDAVFEVFPAEVAAAAHGRRQVLRVQLVQESQSVGHADHDLNAGQKERGRRQPALVGGLEQQVQAEQQSHEPGRDKVVGEPERVGSDHQRQNKKQQRIERP